MTRYNLISPRPRKDNKTHWHTIGSAFTRDKGGFSLVFDSLPLPDAEGRVTVLMTEPLPDNGQQQGRAKPEQGRGYGAGGSANSGRSDMDDEIPFAPEFR